WMWWRDGAPKWGRRRQTLGLYRLRWQCLWGSVSLAAELGLSGLGPKANGLDQTGCGGAGAGGWTSVTTALRPEHTATRLSSAPWPPAQRFSASISGASSVQLEASSLWTNDVPRSP